MSMVVVMEIFILASRSRCKVECFEKWMFQIVFSIKSSMWLMRLFFWLGPKNHLRKGDKWFKKRFITKCREKMACATIKMIILLYNKTNGCLSSLGLRNLVYLAWVGEKLFI